MASIHDPAFPMYFENNHSVQIAGGLSKLEYTVIQLLSKPDIRDDLTIRSVIDLAKKILFLCSLETEFVNQSEVKK